jgi:hypothetical protein
VITDDEVIRLFQRADPARVDDHAAVIDAADYLDMLRGWGRPRVTLTETNPAGPPARHRWRLIAAAAVVAIVVGALWLVGRNHGGGRHVPSEPATTAPATPEAAAANVARGFLDAYVANDADRALTFLGDDALTEAFGSRAQLRLELTHNQAQGYRQMIGACVPQGESVTEFTFRCPFDFHAIGSDELGRGPYGGNYWELTVEDGKVVAAEETVAFTTNGFSAEMWEPFAHWVSDNYPADAAVMYTDLSRTLRSTTAESARLWDQHTSRYVAAHTDGLVGLPPDGATPSSPETGELVASMWSHISADEAWGNGWLYVYADGRLVSSHFPAGWIERRLTPEAVELVRAEIISTGLFDPDHPPRIDEAGVAPRSGGDIQVRDGDRLVYVPRRSDAEWAGEFDQLLERLRELESWLPPSAWENSEPTTYVSSTYAICVSSRTGLLVGEPSFDPSAVFSLLPAVAESLLSDARHWRWDELSDIDPGAVGRVGSGSAHCFDVTTSQARTLARALNDADIEHDTSVTLIYRFDAPAPISRTIDLLFLPYLPHGAPAETGG